MGYETILYETRDKVACITLNRPDKLNAINNTMERELWDVYDRAERDENVWTILITGNGRALCTGADVNVMDDPATGHRGGEDRLGDSYLSAMRQWDAPQEATPPYLRMTKPIICAVNGFCCGAGLDLVTTSDIVIASDQATFFDPTSASASCRRESRCGWRGCSPST